MNGVNEKKKSAKNSNKQKMNSSANANNFTQSEASVSSLSVNTSGITENKKITIRDLCPEEKQKIGELLKKLADEKEEKEKLKKMIEEEKRNFDNKMDSIMKERENLTTSNLSNSINLKAESFMESFVPIPMPIDRRDNQMQSDNHIDMRNLRERFNKLFETLKKTAQNQEDMFTKYSNTISETSSHNISASVSILKEEKPLILEYKPTPIDNEISLTKNNYSPINAQIFHNYNQNQVYNVPSPKEKNFYNENLLQTSIININDEIKENINHNLFSERSFESSDEMFNNIQPINIPRTSSGSNYMLSAKKLQNLREKIEQSKKLEKQRESREESFNNFINNTQKGIERANADKNKNKYKQMLNRVREKSQEQAHNNENFEEEENEDHYQDYKFQGKSSTNSNKLNKYKNYYEKNVYPMSKNELAISNNNFEIKSLNDSRSRSVISPKYQNNSHQGFSITSNHPYSKKIPQFDEEDEQLISILNSNNNKTNLITSLRTKFDLKESTLDVKADFYEDNLFDLIDEIENKEHFYKQKQILKKSKINEEIEYTNPAISNMKINYDIEKE